MQKIELSKGKKIYFASDFHLGAPNFEKSRKREDEIVAWLDCIKADAEVVFLVGDLFDFWFEYKTTIPKGYSRFFGKLAELSDSGIRLLIFTGNHDMWQSDYFSKEFNAILFRSPTFFEINGKKFLIGHGDGLGPGDYSYKLLKKVFNSPISKFLFGRVLHSNFGMKIGTLWAGYSWQKHEKTEDVYVFDSKEKEILWQYCVGVDEKQHNDFYVFGHRHFKLDIQVGENSRYINLGDWIRFYSYGEFDGTNFKLLDWNRK